MLSPLSVTLLIHALGAVTSCFAADPNDWVNVNYVLKQPGSSASDITSSAQKTITKNADSTAKDGPWTVTSSKVKPPSGDIHDYLSWAPYHWPDCNWCSKGSNHFANSNVTDDSPSNDLDSPDNSGDDDDDDDYDEALELLGKPGYVIDDLLLFKDTSKPSSAANAKRSVLYSHHRTRRVGHASPLHISRFAPGYFRRGDNLDPDVAPPIVLLSVPAVVPIPPTEVSQPVLPTPPPDPLADTTTRKGVAGTPAPAEAHAKTTQGKAACTPSPTKSLAPSATWTTCPYVVKDGKVNPDVRTLPGPSLLQNMPESVLYNGVTYALTKSQVHSQNAAKFIDTFFLASATAMHPNMNFGQLVRGPGKDHQMGTFTGILDLRALVKVVNAVQIMKSMKSPDWTTARDQAFTTWMKSYINWLQTSTIGKETAAKANNHLTFYVNQLAAAQLYIGDTKGASATLSNYFKNQFLDQIAASGEQPFEAVRTRPYHYRAFNLEAMITNAKLGDQLGINFWVAKSKYGTTIQTALDYAIAQDPGKEDLDDIFPHVASVAAAYGDSKGKYKSFLQSKMSSYQSEAWWFYDQTAALPNSPAAGKVKRSEGDGRSVTMSSTLVGARASVDDGAAFIPFTCPAVFANSPEVELEDGLFVSCDELKPFFEIAADPSIIDPE